MFLSSIDAVRVFDIHDPMRLPRGSWRWVSFYALPQKNRGSGRGWGLRDRARVMPVKGEGRGSDQGRWRLPLASGQNPVPPAQVVK